MIEELSKDAYEFAKAHLNEMGDKELEYIQKIINEIIDERKWNKKDLEL